jgi:hypothetical protein
LTIDYGRVVPVLVEAIKELNKEIQKLKLDNIELNKKLDDLMIMKTI